MANIPFTPEMPTRWPLAVEPSNRDSSTGKDARLVNAYIETHGSDIQVIRRAGYEVYANPGSGTGRGIYNWQGDIYSIVDGTVRKNGAVIGAVANSGRYDFTSILGAVPKLVFGNTTNSYSYSTATGLAALSGGTQAPGPKVPGWAYVDGTLYYMTGGGQIYGSGINDITDWSAVNFLSAQVEPDAGVALYKQLVYVVAFKQWTTEIFYDRGNATGSPLAPVQGALVPWGCSTADSIQAIEGKLLWLGASKNGATEVLMMENLKVRSVSTKWVEKLFQKMDLTQVHSWSFKAAGHLFYVITSMNLNLTLAYDITEGFWSQWTDTNGNYMQLVSSTFLGMVCLVQDMSSGKTYSIMPETNTDDGALTTMEVITPNFDAGTGLRKTLNIMRLVGDIAPGSIIQARCNDFDYDPAKWTNWRSFDMSTERPMIVNCGTFQRRAYHFQHRLNTPVRIKHVDLQLSPGTL